MTPLLVLLACLPGVFALTHYSLNDQDAQIGLSAIQRTNLGEPTENLQNAETPSAYWMAPINTWMTATSLNLSPFRPAISLALPSYFGVMLLVIAGFWFAKRLFDLRVALIFAILLTMTGSVLDMTQQVHSSAWALMLCAVSLTCLLEHCNRSTSAYSMYLLIAGVTAGLSMLVGGTVVLAVLAIQSLMLVSRIRHKKSGKQNLRIGRQRQLHPKRVISSLGILIAVAFVTGGWWFAYQTQQNGSQFLSAWFTGIDPNTAVEKLTLPTQWPLMIIVELIEKLGPLIGLFLFGLVELCRHSFPSTIVNSDDKHRHESKQGPSDDRERESIAAQTLLAWLFIGILFWFVNIRNGEVAPAIVRMWSQFVVFASVMIAAYCIACIIRRRIGLAQVIAILVITMLDWTARTDVWNTANIGHILQPTIVMTVILSIWLFVSRHRNHAQTALRATVLVLLLLNSFAGMNSAMSRNVDPFLDDYYDRLARLQNVQGVTLVTPHEAPPKLRLLLQVLERDAPLHFEENWSLVDLASTEVLEQQRLLVGWGVRPLEPSDITTDEAMIETAYAATFFNDRILRTYRLSPVEPTQNAAEKRTLVSYTEQR